MNVAERRDAGIRALASAAQFQFNAREADEFRRIGFILDGRVHPRGAGVPESSGPRDGAVGEEAV
jgi:hypothetical protein